MEKICCVKYFINVGIQFKIIFPLKKKIYNILPMKY